jgi:hypothetical protein
LTLIDTKISANTVDIHGYESAWGGGIRNEGSLTIIGSTITQNKSVVRADFSFASGGGISNTGSLSVDFGTISNNIAESYGSYADSRGGGVDSSGPLTITSSTISGNHASTYQDEVGQAYGGGINSWSTLTIQNSTIANNGISCWWTPECFSGGGGIRTHHLATVTHSTIAGNTGGIDIGGEFTLRNSIVAKNTGANSTFNDINGTITSSGYNLISESAGGSGYVPSDILDVDPKLGPLQNNGGPTLTMALLPGSPAIDSGTNQGAPEWDQRGPGFPRVVNGTIDRGAFEVQATGAPAPVLDFALLITADFDMNSGITEG